MISVIKGVVNWKYILLFSFLIVIVGGGVFWFAARQEPQFNWETYTNTDGEYSFQYRENGTRRLINLLQNTYSVWSHKRKWWGVEYMGTFGVVNRLKTTRIYHGIESGSISETAATINEQSVVISILPKASQGTDSKKSVSFGDVKFLACT